MGECVWERERKIGVVEGVRERERQKKERVCMRERERDRQRDREKERGVRKYEKRI